MSVTGIKVVGKDRVFMFERELPVRISFPKLRYESIDYYYSLGNIVRNLNYIYLGAMHFGGHEWAKLCFLNKNGYLLTGYFT